MGRSTVESIGKSAAILAAVEVGLGSFLHGLRVPFAGKLLSLNQTFLLSWFSRNHPESDRGFAAEISAITALLKSLSPMGKKLTPMLGISTQGLLFSFGVFICGNNIIGSVLGSILAGTWAFIQPILLYFLIYGATLFKVVDFYIQAAKKWFPVSPQNLLWAVAILVIIKLFLHAVLALAAWSFKSDKIESYVSKISRAHKKWGLSNPKTLIQGIKSDLTQPFFMFSLLLTSVFLIFSESDRTRVILGVLKPLATAFLCFLCIRLLPLEKIKSESLKRALKYLKGI